MQPNSSGAGVAAPRVFKLKTLVLVVSGTDEATEIGRGRAETRNMLQGAGTTEVKEKINIF